MCNILEILKEKVIDLTIENALLKRELKEAIKLRASGEVNQAKEVSVSGKNKKAVVITFAGESKDFQKFIEELNLEKQFER